MRRTLRRRRLNSLCVIRAVVFHARQPPLSDVATAVREFNESGTPTLADRTPNPKAEASSRKLEANTHKSAKTHTGNVFVTRDLDLKINVFPGLILEHFCAKFGDPSCTVFWYIVWKNRQTHNTNKRR